MPVTKTVNTKGHRNKQTRRRNRARREFRERHPEHGGKQLNRWPLDRHWPCFI